MRGKGNGILNRFQESVLHGDLDQATLQFVGEGARGQGQRPIERVNAGCSIAGVAHAVKLHGTEDRLQDTGAEPATGVPHRAGCLRDTQRGPHITVATAKRTDEAQPAASTP